MADNKFRSWVGFKEETVAVPTENAVERIRQLETQLADLRSRRDITSLSKEEFEILAGETAMSLIKTAQQRESRATSSAEQMVAEATRITKDRLESSENKATAILAGAESRGRAIQCRLHMLHVLHRVARRFARRSLGWPKPYVRVRAAVRWSCVDSTSSYNRWGTSVKRRLPSVMSCL